MKDNNFLQPFLDFFIDFLNFSLEFFPNYQNNFLIEKPAFIFIKLGHPSVQNILIFFPLSSGKPFARANMLNGILPLHAIFLFSWYP